MEDLEVLSVLGFYSLTKIADLGDCMDEKNMIKLDEGIKRMAIKLLSKSSKAIANNILLPIIDADYPYDEFIRRSECREFLSSNINKFFDEGCAGYLVHDLTLYPIRVTVNERADQDHIVKKENDFVADIAQIFITDMGIGEASIDVQLFSHYGWSGNLKTITATRKDPAEKQSLRSLFRIGAARKQRKTWSH